MLAIIDQYRMELSELAMFADSTVENYVSCIVSFTYYIKVGFHVEPQNCKGLHIINWMAEIKKTGVSASRLNHHRCALKTFFAFLKKIKIVNKNPVEALPPIRRTKSKKNKPISTENAFKLLGVFDRSTWIGKRNFLIIAIFWALGLRLSELTSLKVKDFEPDSLNRIGLLRIKGKNKKQRALFVVDNLFDAFIEYLNDPAMALKKNDPLFPIINGNAISNSRVRKMIGEHAQLADVSERVVPHVLRHSFATEMYKHNVPVSDVQVMLGHDNVSETAVYIHVSDELQKSALDLIRI